MDDDHLPSLRKGSPMTARPYRCRRCGHSYPWQGGISFGAVCELGRLIREHYANEHPGTETGR